MSDGVNLVAPGIVAFCLVPLALWGEAIWNGPRRLRILVTVLLIWWLLLMSVLIIPDLICEGSAIKGFTQCRGLMGATF